MKSLRCPMANTLLITSISVLTFLCTTNSSFAHSPHSELVQGEERVLIGFKDGTGWQAAERNRKWIRESGGTVRYCYRFVPAVAVKLSKTRISKLRADPRVAYIEADVKVHALDAELDNSWGVKRIDAGKVHPYNKGSGVKVAIIDTGIDYDHPDLSANYHGGHDFANDDNNPMDDNGHGTHCAGIIAALDNNTGVIGVAPKACLHSIKVLDSSGSGYVSDVIAGIQWAVDNGMDIISMSFGSNSNSRSLQNACDNAYSNGLTLVAAAGNDYKAWGSWWEWDTVDYPAKYDSVIAVGATDKNNNKASWSSTGSALELAAPGVSIYSTYWNDSYTTKSGTSMSCPHVAGVAALILAGEPGLSNAQVRTRLRQTANDLGSVGRDKWYGYGLVDADEAAPGPANNPPAAYDDTITTPEDTSVTIDVLANDTDADSDPLTVTNLTQPSNGSATLTAEQMVTYTPNMNFNGSDAFTYTANDGKTNSNTATVYTTVTNENDPPIADPQSVETTQNTPIDITLSGSDVDGDSLTYDTVDGPSHGTLSGTASNITYTPKNDYIGPDSFNFIVNDGIADSGLATVSITITKINQSPAAEDQSVTTNEDVPIDITLTGSDPDSDSITFSIFSPPTNGTLELDSNFSSNGKLTYTPELNFNGSDEFTFKVNDDKIDSAPATISITVNPINDSPEITSNPVTTATESLLYTYDVDAVDPEGDNLIYSLIVAPSNMMINKATGLIEWEPNNEQIGSNYIKVEVKDDKGAWNIQEFYIDVNPATPPSEEFTFTGSIGRRQENRHTVTIAQPGAASMSVKLSWNRWSDLVLRIYNPSGTLVKEVDQNNWRNNVEQTTIHNLSAGKWKVAAYSKWGWSTTYTLEGVVNY